MKILFVEDNPDFYKVVEGLLRAKGGHDITTVDNADDAIAELNHLNKYELVILDLMMMLGTKIGRSEAEETGVAIYRRIRAIDKKIRVMFLTALPRSECMPEEPGDEYLTYYAKPILSGDVLRFMKAVEGR